MILVYIFYLYILIGSISALGLLLNKKNHVFGNLPLGVKFLVFPGSLLLWPIVLYKSLSK